jgi:alpha-glucosidase (family GH31 glycosyl hydrolase)
MSVLAVRSRFCLAGSAMLGLLLLLPAVSLAEVERFKYSLGSSYLVVELLDDHLAHFEVSAFGPGPDTSQPVLTSPMVDKKDYAGPASVSQSGPGGTTLETPGLRLTVHADTLCVDARNKVAGVDLTTICPLSLAETKGLSIAPGVMQNVYGLGEQFITSGSADGDWVGRVRSPGDAFGNQMVGFDNGAAGNAQFPIMYAVGPQNANYALFLDDVYKQNWNFTGNPWRMESAGDQIRWYLLIGRDLPDLRSRYMELTGYPPVPPKKMFGLWVSEYGFDNWGEINGKLATLRAHKFPIDGFILDLQWFGNVTKDSENSNMGRLTWDAINFPNAAATLAAYRNNDGIGIVTIEESYVSRGLAEHQDLKNRGFLVRAGCATCDPVFLAANPWWGKGGMIDWTQDAAADYWHDLKRQKLIDDGVIGHWIDLGEPEMYDPNDWVAGVMPGKHGQADYHNMYNFMWAQSIARGYARNGVAQRPFMMARSGAPGIQRFGVAMWSADIGGDLANLATNENAQMHMSFSGIDYFGSDIGGFHRGGLSGDALNDTYTQWFADGAMFDVPVRPHTENLCNCKETAPDRVGDLASNLANIGERYELSPYLYSLAYRAYLFGEPVAPPPVFYYQNDAALRTVGNEKMLGRDLLVGIAAKLGETQRDIYLPAGDWIDFRTQRWIHSSGQTLAAQPERTDGAFRLPAFARAGAIIPRMFVDDKTMNILGKRSDGSTRDDLIVRVYASATPSSFPLYEDDGQTVAYLGGATRVTPLSQHLAGATGAVTVGPASGNYADAPSSRNVVVELVTDNAPVTGVSINGVALAQLADAAAFEAGTSGWLATAGNLTRAKSGNVSVSVGQSFTFALAPRPPDVIQPFACANGATVPGQSVCVVGNIAELGAWRAASAIKLEPTHYPQWRRDVIGLPANTRIEWKCIKRRDTGDTSIVDQWQPGDNNVVTTVPAGTGAVTTGDFQPVAGVSETFACDNGITVPGQSVYVVGSVARLGNWSPAAALKLDPADYPLWRGTIGNLPASTRVEWKCIKRRETGDIGIVDMWQPGANNVLTTAPSGYGGMTTGDFWQ